MPLNCAPSPEAQVLDAVVGELEMSEGLVKSENMKRNASWKNQRCHGKGASLKVIT